MLRSGPGTSTSDSTFLRGRDPTKRYKQNCQGEAARIARTPLITHCLALGLQGKWISRALVGCTSQGSVTIQLCTLDLLSHAMGAPER